jgi:hypothetical protein
MNKKLLALFTSLMVSLTPFVYGDDGNSKENKGETFVEQDGRVHITWSNYDQYADIRHSQSTRSKFRKQLFRTFDKHFEMLAKNLPKGHELHLIVTEVDLAGQVWPSSASGVGALGNDMRIVNRAWVPVFGFDYRVVDAHGVEVLKEDSVLLRDLNYLDHAVSRFNRDPFVHEKTMITDWYKRTINIELAQATS